MDTVDRDSVREEQLAHVLGEIGRLEAAQAAAGPALSGRLAAEIRKHKRLAAGLSRRARPAAWRAAVPAATPRSTR